MRIVEGFREPSLNRMLGAWCAREIGLDALQQPYSTLGILDGESLVAVVAYNNYHRREGVVEMHAASITPRWLTRPVLYRLFDFAFNRLECQTVVLRVDPDNRRLSRILTAYGFDCIRLPRLRGRDRDELLFILHDDVWAGNGFHKENAHGQERSRAA